MASTPTRSPSPSPSTRAPTPRSTAAPPARFHRGVATSAGTLPSPATSNRHGLPPHPPGRRSLGRGGPGLLGDGLRRDRGGELPGRRRFGHGAALDAGGVRGHPRPGQERR